MRRALIALIAFIGYGGCAPAEQPERAIPHTGMPEAVYKILRESVECYAFGEGAGRERREKNLWALEALRAAPWPDFSKLERVRVFSAKEPKESALVWRLAGRGEELALLLPDFTERTVSSKTFSKVEAADYVQELAGCAKFLRERGPNSKRPWGFTFLQDFRAGGFRYYRGVFLVHHAYAAAFFGKAELAMGMVHGALEQDTLPFEMVEDQGAWQLFAAGVALLEAGAPRAEVSAKWEAALNVYFMSHYREQLLDYTTTLKGQVEEDKKLAADAVKEPEKLPQAERIQYYIARFPDVHGVQFSQPGHCATISLFPGRKAKDTWFSDCIVEIGRPAVPVLIEHLTDTRLTRSIGFWRDLDPHRTVLRVQDVAVQCLERILDVDFYRPSGTSSYLSNEKPEVREKVIADIKAWWKANGNRTPLEGHWARLEQGSLYDRIRTLHKIEAIDSHAVDSVATLKRWERTTDYQQLPVIAEALARRHDLSLLPVMRKMVREKSREKKIPNEAVWFVLKYGDADDYRYLKEAAREDIRAGATLGASRIFGSVKGGLWNSDNPLAVPILVDFLDQRKITGARWVGESKGSMGFSCADSCIGTLIRITGHDEGYKLDDPVEKRYAAIDQWLAWWKREGQQAFIKKYPDVAKVIGVEGK